MAASILPDGETKTPVEKKLDTALGLLGLGNGEDGTDEHSCRVHSVAKDDPIEQNILNGTYDAGDEHSLLMAPKRSP